MVFNSLPFVVFFLLVLGLYRVLPHRGQNWLLLAASYAFYASWDWRFLGLLVASTAVAYVCGLVLGRLEDGRPRTLVPPLGPRRASRAAGVLQVLQLLHGEPRGAAWPRRVEIRRLHLEGAAAGRHLVLHVRGDGLRDRRVSASHRTLPRPRGCGRLHRVLPDAVGRADRARLVAAAADQVAAIARRRAGGRGHVADSLGLLQEDVRGRQSGPHREPGVRGRTPPPEASPSHSPPSPSPSRSTAISRVTRTSRAARRNCSASISS